MLSDWLFIVFLSLTGFLEFTERPRSRVTGLIFIVAAVVLLVTKIV